MNKTHIKTASFFVTLFALTIYSCVLVISNFWQQPLAELFSPSSNLSLKALANQMLILPTMVIAVFAGGLLGVISILLQQLVKNTLASDTTLAIGSGSQFSLLIVTLFFPTYGLYGNFWIAFIGALLSMGIIFLISLPSRLNPMVLVLSGLIINIFLSAFSSVLLVFFSEKSLGVMAWNGGMLTQSHWHSVKILAITSVLLLIGLLPLIKPLTLMSLDDKHAKSLGVPVDGIRIFSIVLVAAVSALVVSEVGVLSFIGLGAATLVNALGIKKLSLRFFVSFVLGGVVLLLTSNLVTMLDKILPIVIPAGSMTGILSAPLIIWLILQQKKSHVEETTPTLVVERKPINWAVWGSMALAIFMMVICFVDTLNGWAFSTDWQLTYQNRLPRSLSAAATGVMLASAGVLLQTFTRNPMASPEVLGVSSGAAIGVLISVLVFPLLGLSMSLGNMLIAGSLGALAVLLLILWLARSLHPAYLLLVGIAISAMMNGILGIIKLLGDPRLQAVLSWLSGTTYSAKPESVWWLIVTAIVFFTASCLLIKPLRLMSLGSSVAKGLGVHINLFQWLIMLVVACLSAAATLAVGPLSFIGLMVPHLALSLGANELHKQLPLSALLGAILMLLADWIGRYIIFPYEIPAGSIAALIGGIYFIYLMRHMSIHE